MIELVLLVWGWSRFVWVLIWMLVRFSQVDGRFGVGVMVFQVEEFVK